jgi:carbon storage regulator
MSIAGPGTPPPAARPHREEGASAMLVLSRQRDETIMIGDEIEITVVDIRGDKVRLGITAPRHIAVHRKEVYDAIKRENREASQMGTDDVSDVTPPKPPPPEEKNNDD